MRPRTSTRNQQVARVVPPYPSHITTESNTTSYNTKFEDKNSIFECAICMATLYDPRILPCHHRFCRGCIERWIETTYKQQCEKIEELNAERAEINLPPKAIPNRTEAAIDCPYCRQTFSPIS